VHIEGHNFELRLRVPGYTQHLRLPPKHVPRQTHLGRSTPLVSLCPVGFARLALAEGDPERAARLAGAADGLRRRVGLRAWPMLRRGEAELVAQIRQAVGADRFDQLYTAGSRLNQRQAVAAARDRHGAGAAAS
jgi:hypothetical protein